MSSFKPSHYLVRVENLGATVADYEAAGFTVSWGSPQEVAHNALIHFEAGGFIELYTAPSGPEGEARQRGAAENAAKGIQLFQRFHRMINVGRGFCDFALETELPLGEALVQPGERVPLSGTIPSKRLQESGVETQWEIAFPKEDLVLPFLMGPYDPAPVITDEMRSHANGLKSLNGLRLRHPEPMAFLERLALFFSGAELLAQDQGATLVLGDFECRVESGEAPDWLALLSRQAPEGGLRLPGLKIQNL
ncbi:MAG: VOC family protein [Pseudomonadota bacterium]